jgi:hypothetical protein
MAKKLIYNLYLFISYIDTSVKKSKFILSELDREYNLPQNLWDVLYKKNILIFLLKL